MKLERSEEWRSIRSTELTDVNVVDMVDRYLDQF